MNVNLKELYASLMKKGLTTYKEIGSKASLPALVEAKKLDSADRKGAIFAVRSKADFTDAGVRGYIVGSLETLVEDANRITHFTPNVYRTFGYSNEKRTKIFGFEEENLLQVNTFVVDIDTKEHSVQDIVVTAMDESVGVPSMILESDRGYQVYFVLEQPIYISNKNNFISLKVAKRIAENIKRSLKDVDADIFCNSFGFFRAPNSSNVVWYRPEVTYHAKDLIDWSTRQDDNSERQLFVVPSSISSSSLIDTDWFQALITATDVKGEKGMIGRNNLLFTVALACLKDGLSESDAFDLIDQVNANFNMPLKGKALKAIAASAFSGRYHGPSKEYVEQLIELHVKGNINVSFGTQKWVKHRKERADRERVHFSEWEEDYVEYINAKGPFVQCTQAEICAALNMPKSTLNELVKKSKNVIKKTLGRGRAAVTTWTTPVAFIKYAIKVANERKAAFRGALKEIVAQANLGKLPGEEKVNDYVAILTKENEEYRDYSLYDKDIFA